MTKQGRVFLWVLLSTATAAPAGRYVPGNPGGPWTEEELVITKSKLWRMFDWTVLLVHEKLRLLHGPGWEKSNLETELTGTGRMGPSTIRLGFHGCVRDDDGTGGCRGQLYWDGIGRIFMDYLNARSLPNDVREVPNFNNGLGPPVKLLEEIYTNVSFPEDGPSLKVSLRDSGKSRADLWAFAGMVAVEYAIFTNNEVCKNTEFQWPLAYPDGLESNSYWGKHCTQKLGMSNCQIEIKPENRFIFRSGRKDGLPFEMYKKTSGTTCPDFLDIVEKDDCEDAAAEKGVAAEFKESETPHCKVTGGGTLCHADMKEKYNYTGYWYFVTHPLTAPAGGVLTPCRADLDITTETECKAAAKWLYLEYGGKELNVSGCFVMQSFGDGWGGSLASRVYFGEGPPCPEQMDPPKPWVNMRTVCRHEHEKVGGYMASTWGHEPDSQKGGDYTAKWMEKEFGLNTRETVALMGAHTMGRFHSRSELIRYIWVRNGGQMWNNEYYRNLANLPAYRFVDDCSTIGDAWGQPSQGKWVPGGSMTTHFGRGEQKNGGPFGWVLDRHMCTIECVKNVSSWAEPGEFIEPCCTNIPQGASCMPDNGRPKGSNATLSDDDLHHGCEVWNTEGGNHELALSVEMGMMFQFTVDENGMPEKCEGFRGGDGPHGEKGCKLQDYKAAGETMQMHEYVEIFAHDQNLWANEYMAVWEKTMQNGYETSQLTELPHVDLTSGLICPTAHKMIKAHIRYAQCFFPKDLSDPFILISDMDQRILEMNATSGGLLMGDVRPLDVLKDPLKVQELPPTSVWRTLKTEHGDMIVNGIYEYGVGRLVYNETTNEIRGKDDYLERTYAGVHPEVILADYQAPVKNMARWLKPMYFAQEQLSPPFIIFSELDLKLLQVNEVNGSLELRQWDPEVLRNESKITELPPKALWYTAGDQLVNGLVHAPFGKLTLKDGQLIGGQGYLTRNYPGVYPEVLFASKPPEIGYAKPEYHDTSKLSGPFVLISEMDRKILEVSDENASLEVVALTDLSVLSNASKVSNLPKKALWYEAADGQLVNGLVGSASMKWKFTGTEIVCPEKGTLGRNWPGVWPQVIYAKNWSGQIWYKPEYFTDDQLSEPFVLYSEMDYHLLQMNEETGALETSPVFNSEVFTDKTKLASVSKAALWYLAKTGDGNQLVNGLFHASFGKLIYNESTGKIGKIDNAGGEGYAKRYGAWDVVCSNETKDETLWIWVRPAYVSAASLSSRFVLVSEMDNRLLQVNSTTGLLEMGAVRDIAMFTDPNFTSKLPINEVWSTYDVGSHQYLYSGLMGFAYGNLTIPVGKDHVMHGSKGYLARNWAGSFPEVLYWDTVGGTKSMYTWYKPTFISEDKLSAPFVLISNMDNRLLEANNLTGELQVGEMRPLEVLTDPDHVKSLNKRTWWHLATTDTGTWLVNGLVRNAVGDLVYNSSTSFITKDDGDTKYIARNGKGAQPEVITWDSVGAITVRAMQIWIRPLSFAADTLSEPSVLISEMDQKLLQVNEKTGELEVGEKWEPSCVLDLSKVQALPAKAMWHLVEGAEGHVLVNKVFHYVAQLDYNTSNFHIVGSSGYLTRNYPGQYPEVLWEGALAEGWKVSYQRFFEPSKLPETSS